MTSTTYSLNRMAAAAGTTQPETTRAEKRTARVLSGLVTAGVVAAIVVAVGAAAGERAASGEFLPWLSVWVVAFLALMAGAYITRGLSRQMLHSWQTLRARRIAARTERAIALAVRNDPRMARELQLMRDRAEWSART